MFILIDLYQFIHKVISHQRFTLSFDHSIHFKPKSSEWSTQSISFYTGIIFHEYHCIRISVLTDPHTALIEIKTNAAAPILLWIVLLFVRGLYLSLPPPPAFCFSTNVVQTFLRESHHLPREPAARISVTSRMCITKLDNRIFLCYKR